MTHDDESQPRERAKVQQMERPKCHIIDECLVEYVAKIFEAQKLKLQRTRLMGMRAIEECKRIKRNENNE